MCSEVFELAAGPLASSCKWVPNCGILQAGSRIAETLL